MTRIYRRRQDAVTRWRLAALCGIPYSVLCYRIKTHQIPEPKFRPTPEGKAYYTHEEARAIIEQIQKETEALTVAPVSSKESVTNV